MNRRSFLLLQGPQSRFFKRLGASLVDQGHNVTKVNFCGGDLMHWHGANTRIYNRPLNQWKKHVTRLMGELRVTDLLLFGDLRQIHLDAIEAAEQWGVRIYVFEEGYLQPNFITFERGGVNARSPLPSTADEVHETAEKLPPVQDLPVIPNSLKIRVMDTVRHHVGNVVFWGVFPFYRTHRPYVIGRELLGWLPRYLTRKRRAAAAAEMQARILNDPSPFFLYPLQLNADFQIRLNSCFKDVPDAIRHIMGSFAEHAPTDTRLVIKNHPLDNGLIDYAAIIRKLSQQFGLNGRVIFLDGGDGKKLIDQCKGVVLVNSTMGLESLLAGKPVYCLGKAIYAFPGLAGTPEAASLGDFWHNPGQADVELLGDFVKVLHHRALIRGNYYTDEGIRTAVEGVLNRLAL